MLQSFAKFLVTFCLGLKVVTRILHAASAIVSASMNGVQLIDSRDDGYPESPYNSAFWLLESRDIRAHQTRS